MYIQTFPSRGRVLCIPIRMHTIFSCLLDQYNFLEHSLFYLRSRMSDFVTITTCLLAVSALLVTVEWFWPMAGLHRDYCLPRIIRPVLNGSGLFYQSLVAHLNSINRESDFWIDSHSHQVSKSSRSITNKWCMLFSSFDSPIGLVYIISNKGRLCI